MSEKRAGVCSCECAAHQNENAALKAKLAKVIAHDWRGCQPLFKELGEDRDRWKALAEKYEEGLKHIDAMFCEGNALDHGQCEQALRDRARRALFDAEHGK